VKALAVLPLPCDARLFSKIVTAVARSWESGHRGQKMPMTHMETRTTEFGKALIIWDEPAAEPGGDAHAR
jgi:hypothetical protein